MTLMTCIALLAMGCAVWKTVDWMSRESTARRARERESAIQRAAAERQAAADRRLRDQNQRARQLQIALLELQNARDFQRAASWAKQCLDIPLAFRQRQYRRFRPELLQHATRRLAGGQDRESLRQSLHQLVTALGVAGFEADYILAEAAESQPRQAEQPIEAFETRLRELQNDHRQRMDVLRNLQDVDSEIRDQLVEAEERRFQQRLFGNGPR
jgi:hypothetical protein